ncbi:MAG: MBL fold metallo-hydrolase [Candidatus Muiribacteriota bacterium]
MKICIHRGTNEIGGNCIELESNGKRIILDLGIPLEADKDTKKYLPDIKGLIKYSKKLLGILISHIHMDHIGLLPYINKKIPIYMGESSKSILINSAKFQYKKFDYNQFDFIKIENKITFNIGPFKITPYLMDHSAYDSYAFLIEADGKSVFYTGDFRETGRKHRLTQELLKTDLKNVDCMLIEGTTINNSFKKHSTKSEKDVEREMVKEFKNCKGLAFVQASSQNIDRIVSIYRACIQSSRVLIYDLYTSLIMEGANNPNIPQSNWNNVKLFIPQIQRIQIKNNKWFEDLAKHSSNRIYLEDIKKNPEKYVLLFRGIHLTDVSKEKDFLRNAKYIYSLWEGYYNKVRFDKIKNWLTENNIPKISIHSSGHADINTIKKVISNMNPVKIIPIHTECKESFKDFSDKVYLADDKEWINI